jgi:hypothetical protein
MQLGILEAGQLLLAITMAVFFALKENATEVVVVVPRVYRNLQ